MNSSIGPAGMGVQTLECNYNNAEWLGLNEKTMVLRDGVYTLSDWFKTCQKVISRSE